jgi:uncharacterized protein (PEP-CTERM system associated)
MAIEPAAPADADAGAIKPVLRFVGACQTVLIVALTAGSGMSLAQRWQSEVSIATEVGATSNSQLDAATRSKDLIGSVQPRVTVLGEGPRFRLNASAAVNAVTYAEGTRDDDVYPEVDVRATLVPIERFFSVDAGVRVGQAFANPFALRANSGTNVSPDAVTTTQVSLSPTLDVTILPLNVRTRLRSDIVRLYDDRDDPATASATGNYNAHSVSVESLARPLTWAVQADRNETRYVDATPQISENARLRVGYWFTEQFSIGLREGVERNNFIDANDLRQVHGAEFAWRPTERTDLSGFAERRFFGTGWNLNFTHRMPWVSWNLGLDRDISSTPQELFRLPAGGNVAGLLDALLTTRFPDPLERARQVQELIDRTGLPPNLLSSSTIYAQRLSLTNTVTAGIAYTGVLHSIALTAFRSKLQDVPDASLLIVGSPLNNNVQRGGAIALTRRLSPVTVLIASTDWREVRTLDSATISQVTKQSGASIDLQRQLSPRSTGRIGARYTRLVQNDTRTQEAALSVRFDHRF